MSSPNPNTPPAGDSKPIGGGIAIDIGYVKSIPGILTAAYTIVSLIAFICVYSGWWCSLGAHNFFGFVSMTAFLTGLVNYLLYLFCIYQRLGMVPWTLVTLIWCGVWVFFYLIASSVQATYACNDSAAIAGAIFGFLAMILIAGRGYFAFLDFREERNPSSPPQASSGAPPPYNQGGDFVQY